MQKYINNSILIDVLIAIAVGFIIFFSQPFLQDYFKLPKIETLIAFNGSMITVSTALLGFLLTIVTIIVTFKNSFKEISKEKVSTPVPKEAYEIPEETIFERKINKENTFYDTPIHKRVINVFTSATYEVSIVLFFLLTIQFNIIYSSILVLAIFNICTFILLSLTLIRSLFIFRLFLNVHVHND